MHRKTRDLDSVHVPLGLVERKERHKIDRTQEISPERGSEPYKQGYTETKRVEHDAFLTAIGQRQPGEHVVILGEPGAGKTTLLTKVWEWLLEQPGEDIIVAWVPLSAVKNYELEEYLRKSWLKQFCKSGDIDRYWASFEALADAGRVWLLLDGADEMGGEALGKIETTLGEVWARSMRAIVTCRLNLWDAGSTNKLQTSSNFQVYRTLDFKYMNPAGRDEVKGFIDNWFRSRGVSEGELTPAAGQKLRVALDEVGKERIKDLAQNPLRLTLLCAFWEEGQALPETQAGLYELFVDYVYDWKAAEFSEAVKLRGELDRALGVLAKQGINKPSLRFRFTEAELRKWVPVVEQRQALTALGWLNCVGEENQRPVFAFFHPTFQEYFAACSIDDWDYFLPRAHVDRPVACLGEEEIGATYRVFESEWRQPIVLWFGRGDVADEDKEEFIEKLTTFQDGVGDFYYYRAYCMGAIGVGEFKTSKYAEEIVQQTLKWAFGYFNLERQGWINYLNPILYFARVMICITHRDYAIMALIGILLNPDINGHILSQMTKMLGKIAVGNQEVIEALTTFLLKPDIDDSVCISMARVLGKIDAGNQKAISALVLLLINPNIDNSIRHDVTYALGEIAVGNQMTIVALGAFLNESALDDSMCISMAGAISKIDVGNQKAISALIALLPKPKIDMLKRFWVEELLGKIAVGNQEAVEALTTLLLKSDIDAFPRTVVARILGKIAVGNQKSIEALLALLINPNIDDSTRPSIGLALGGIVVGNQEVIEALLILLHNPDINNSMRFSVIVALGKVAVGNQEAIETLLTLILNPYINNSMRVSVIEALGKVAVGNQEAIETLLTLILNPDINNSMRFSVIEALGKVAVGNQEAIETLLILILNPYIDDYHQYFKVAEVLGDIAVGNQEAIETLTTFLLKPDTALSPFMRYKLSLLGNFFRIFHVLHIADRKFCINDFQHFNVVRILGKIAMSNRKSIETLLALLLDPDINDFQCFIVAEALGDIDIGNQKATLALITLFLKPDIEITLHVKVKEILGNLLTKVTMHSVILKIKNSVTNEVYKFNFSIYHDCYEILFQYAQTITYQEFYTAWHKRTLSTFLG